MKAINVELPDDIHAELVVLAERRGRSIKKTIIEVLRQFLSETREVDVTVEELRLLRELREKSKEESG